MITPELIQTLDPSLVQLNLDLCKQVMKELHPELHAQRGAAHDLILHTAAVFAAAMQQEIRDVVAAICIVDIVEDPESFTREQVDDSLSNWFIKRKIGKPANGHITIHTNSPAPLNVPNGTKLRAGGNVYVVSQSFTVNPSHTGTYVASSSFTSSCHNEFVFTIPVQATKKGAMGNIKKGNKLTLLDSTVSHVTNVVAAADFTDGEDDETNTQVIARFNQSLKLTGLKE